MTKANGQGYERQMERALGIPSGSFTIDRPAGQPFLFNIPCDGGRSSPAHTAILERTNMPNPDRIRRVIAAIGSRTNGGHITCPDCIQADRTAKSARKAAPKPAPAAPAPKQETKPMPESNVTPIAAAQPSKDARAMRRSVLEWLEQGYDTDAGRYRPGITDATIAKETGAAAQMVGKLREEFYGEAGAPPEFEALQNKIDALSNDLTAATNRAKQQIEVAQETLEHIRANAMGDIRRLQSELEQTAKRNGWAA